jgi:hypothetical protein
MSEVSNFRAGMISISRPQGDGCDYISIEVNDKSSGVEFIELRISYADFAEAITGLSGIPITFKTRFLDKIGKLREHKEVNVVTFVSYKRYTKEEANAILAPYEVDGWKGRTDDLNNNHRRTKTGYNVTFVRYVDAP